MKKLEFEMAGILLHLILFKDKELLEITANPKPSFNPNPNDIFCITSITKAGIIREVESHCFRDGNFWTSYSFEWRDRLSFEWEASHANCPHVRGIDILKKKGLKKSW